ncbi:hypothetical protein IJ162_01500 [Candidatus Saccharibacteria bacterium]|nr:hypothetical protein [Candidatus Saccharibacteria bacterium]
MAKKELKTKKNSKSRKGKIIAIIGACIVLVAVIVALLFAFVFNNGEEGDTVSSSEKIQIAYDAGEITADEYVNLMLDAQYDADRLPNEYKTNEPFFSTLTDIMVFAKDNKEKLGEKTINRILEITSFSRMEIGSDASNNISDNVHLFSNGSAYADSLGKTVLNRVKVSRNRHFVIFYTDTGRDWISDEDADAYLNEAEDIIERYERIFGLKFEYKPMDNISYDANRFSEHIRLNGLNDDIFKNAMPIYVVNPYGGKAGNMIAQYVGRSFIDYHSSFKDSLDKKKTATYNLSEHVPVYPFFNILPNQIKGNNKEANIKMTMAHEMAHHYIVEHGMEYFSEPKTLFYHFISETLASTMAIVGSPGIEKNNILNDNHNYYFHPNSFETDYNGISIKDISGYITTSFLLSYYKYFPNSLEFLFWQAYGNTNEGTLEALWENAGQEKFNLVIRDWIENNIIGDYGDYPIYIKEEPRYRAAPCRFCTKKYELGAASTYYVKILAEAFKGRTLTVTDAGDISLSIIGKNDGGYTVIDRYGGESKKSVGDLAYEFNDEYKYIILAMGNNNIRDDSSITFKVISNDAMEVFNTSSEQGTKKKDARSVIENKDGSVTTTTKYGGKCTHYDMDSFNEGLDNLSEITEFFSILSGDGSTYRQAQEFIDSLKSNDVNNDELYIVMSCTNELKHTSDYEGLEQKVKAMTGSTTGPVGGTLLYSDFSVFTKIDPGNKSWGLYILVYPLMDNPTLYSVDVGLRE